MKQFLFMLLACQLGCVSAKAQQSVSGQVLDASTNRPLAGANIHLKRENITTHTAADGSFLLRQLRGTDTLIVSYIGYNEQRIPVGPTQTTRLIIRLNAVAIALPQAIVNTGFYQVPKERATGSFSHIDNRLINRSTGFDIISRLEGISSGLQFSRNNIEGENLAGTRPKLRVRGLSTIESNETPLIVLNNFPYDGDISSINPNDVESITILKDAAAASIWGARAGNGVIVITTKTGKYNQAPRIFFSSNVTIGEKPDLFYNQNWLPSETIMGIEKELFERGNYLENPGTPIPSYVELLIKKRDGLISDEEFAKREALLQQTDIRREALEYLYQPSINQQYALSVSGGSRTYRYYLSAGYDKNRTMIAGNENTRLNLNLQNTFRPLENLELTAGLWHAQQRAAGNGLALSNILTTIENTGNYYMPLANAKGEALPIVKDYRWTYADAAESQGLLDWSYRPLDEISIADNTSKNDELRVNASIKYRLLKDFRLNGIYQYVKNNAQSRSYYPAESYYVRNMVNKFTQADGEQVIPYAAILKGGPPTESVSHSSRLQLNYARDFGQDHELAMLGGTEIRQRIQKRIPGYTLYDYDPDVLTANARFDYTKWYQTRPGGGGFIGGGEGSIAEYTDRFLSHFGNVAYTYRQRYVLSGSIRWDGSNIFGVKTNQKGTVLWSSGASWEMSREEFWNLRAISYLRLRLTYGSSGNVNKLVSTYPTIRYYSSGDYDTKLQSARLVSAGNPSLRWEQVRTLNIGLDFRLGNSRLEGSLEYYIKNASDLIGESYIDPTTGIFDGSKIGYTTGLENKINYASMRTHGIDLQLTTRNLKGIFSWNSHILFSYVRNEITHYNTPGDISSIGYYFGSSIPPTEGRSRDVVYSLPWLGLNPATGMPLIKVNKEYSTDYNKYFNEYDPQNLIVSGVNVPPYFGSIRNAFSWKNLLLDFLITWKGGHVFRRNSIFPAAEYESPRFYHMDYFKRWKKSGDELHTNVPAWAKDDVPGRRNAYLYSEALVTKGGHLRLQDINLSYEVPGEQLRNLPLKSLRLYIYFRNLGILWKANKAGLDPDYINASYPAPRTVALGIQMNL